MSALVVDQLRKRYSSGLEALKGIDLRIEAGDFFALLGPNGAGKSTLIGIITSLVNKTSGTVTIYGHDLDQAPEKAKALLGVVPQEFNFNLFLPVMEVVVNQAGYFGLSRRLARQRAEYYLRKLDLWDRRDTEMRRLSGGLKRRLMIARALVHQPRILVLDEPTAGVDIEIRRAMWQYLLELNAEGTTIVLTTHYLEEAEHLCRRLAIIHHGTIITQTDMETLLQQLHTETFLLQLRTPLATPLPTDIAGFPVRVCSEMTLEVEINRERSLNELFQALSTHGLEIFTMRNKQNRLESLFLELVDNTHHAQQA
jgi:ABC-2 type transport system ATP-binding protein